MISLGCKYHFFVTLKLRGGRPLWFGTGNVSDMKIIFSKKSRIGFVFIFEWGIRKIFEYKTDARIFFFKKLGIAFLASGLKKPKEALVLIFTKH